MHQSGKTNKANIFTKNAEPATFNSNVTKYVGVDDKNLKEIPKPDET